jgi:hypothetical protein
MYRSQKHTKAFDFVFLASLNFYIAIKLYFKNTTYKNWSKKTQSQKNKIIRQDNEKTFRSDHENIGKSQFSKKYLTKK